MLPSHIQAHRDTLNARLDDTTTVTEQIDLLNELAWIEREFDAAHSKELCHRAQHLATTGEYQAQPYTRGVIAALRTLGYLHLLSGFEASSTNESLRALELLRDSPDITLEIEVRRNAAWAQLWVGELEQAMSLALPALEMSRQTNDKLREAMVLDAVSAIYHEANEYAQGKDTSLRALQLYREMGDSYGVATMLNNVACNFLELGEYHEAVEYANLSVAHAHTAGYLELYIAAMCTAGEGYLELKATDKAIELLQSCLLESEKNNSHGSHTIALFHLGRAYHARGELDQASRLLHDALVHAEELSMRSTQYKCHELLAAIYESQHNYQTALRHYKHYHALHVSVLKSSPRLHTLPVMRGLALAQRDSEGAPREKPDLQAEIKEHNRSEATLQTLATRDPLTNILNRRHFVALAQEHLETVGSGSPVSLILFDLDHFKTINDTFGHTVGDQVLQTIARLVRDHLREHDLLARFGGEEFILLLPGTPCSDAQQLAERLRELVQSQTIISHGTNMRISISLGVAQVPPDESASVLALIEAADRALNQAKNNGRNQTVVAHWSLPPSAASYEIIPDSINSPQSFHPEI